MDTSHRFVLLGAVEAGKTTLFKALTGSRETVLKTQAMNYEGGMVDTPGEFFSHPRLYHALITTAAEADTLVYVHACNDPEFRLPPGLLEINAGKRVVGVITKIDLPDADPDGAEALLRRHGFHERIFRVSTYMPETLAAFRNYLYGLEEQGKS